MYGHFFFAGKSVIGNIYLDMLINRLVPQLLEDSTDFFFREDVVLSGLCADSSTSE
jgi:hypothetical protein